MKAQYKKYLDALRGKDFSTPAGQYTNALSTASSKLSSAESLINSSQWIEKGLEIIKGSVLPSLKSQVSQLEGGLGALSQVGGKVSELVSACESLENMDTELNSLLPRWSYVKDGKKTQSEVSSHNSKIDELEKKITEQEEAIDGIVAAINGISVSFSSSQAAFSGHISDIRQAVKDTNNNTEEEIDDSSSTLLTSDGKTKYSIPSDPVIAAKKAKFIGDYNDSNNYTHFKGTKAQMKSRKNKLQLFDNTTGEIIESLGEINMKVGEKRVITVKLPSDTGKINRITRTTAYTKGTNILKVKCDIDPDPNKVEYVRIAEAPKGGAHAPSDSSLLQNNCYDWIIEAVAPGRTSATQTTLWESEDSGTYNLKAMEEIFVNVT